MVDLFLRSLHSMGKVFHNMVGIAAKYLMHMIEPRLRFSRVAGHDYRRQVKVEAPDAATVDPSAFRY